MTEGLERENQPWSSQVDLDHRPGSADGLLTTVNLAFRERLYPFSSLLSFR